MDTPTLLDHPGPDEAPAAAPGVGLWSERCWRYRIDAATTESVELDWPAAIVGSVVPADSMLEWAVFPDIADGAAEDVFRACGSGINVVFADGSSSYSPGLREVDGLSPVPAERRHIDWPQQWNHRRLDLGAAAGKRIAAVRLLLDPGTPRGDVKAPLVGWVDGPRIVPAPSLPMRPSERVITTRGSHSSPGRSRGLTQPLTGLPHGGCYLAPATDVTNQHWTYTWNAHGQGPSPKLAGLLVTRAPSIWIGDRGALAFQVGLRCDGDGRLEAEPFDHADEQAHPYRYRVRTASGIEIDATATSNAILAEVDFPAHGTLVLVPPGGEFNGVEVTTSGDLVHITLAVTTASPHEPDPLRGFAAIALCGATARPACADEDLAFDIAPGRLRIECGTSFISAGQAEYARQQVAGRGVDDVADEAQAAWDEVTSIVEAPASSVDDQAALASDLYRLFLYPTAHHELTPDGPRYADPTKRAAPDQPTHTGRGIRAGRFLTDHGFWDTYRTCWPAFHLLVPDRAGELIEGFLEHVRLSGWSPRWSAGSPLDAMVGTSFDIITADAVASGITGFDIEAAYRAALRNATAASDEPRFGRAVMPGSLFRGYTSAETAESVSWTLEGAINDAGATVLARELARTSDGATAARLRAEARYLAGRALDYDRLFDQATGFFRPRTAGGDWADEPFDPRVWGGGHTETNAWGSRVSVPHDGAGLARLLGGPDRLGDTLDALFAEPETASAAFAGSYGSAIHEMFEARDLRLGMCGLSNQPAHHVPWMYAFTDRPWRRDEIMRNAISQLFCGLRIGQGFPGDEDNGEMSAWRMFGVLGLAPLQVGSGHLLIGAPQLPLVVVRPLGGSELTIRALRASDADVFVNAVQLDGEPWHEPTVPVRRLRQGGVLTVTLGERPLAWSEPMPDEPFFSPDDAPARRWRDVLTVARVDGVPRPELCDDEGGRTTQLPDGSVLELELSTGCAGLVQVTFTLDRPGEHALAVDGWHDGQWRPAADFVRERWDWPRQTRPFDLVLPASTDRLRVRWRGTALARQVQVLAPS